MFGYIVPNKNALSKEDELRYRSFYCGLCHALGERYHKRGRMTLQYDMTFFAVLFASLYEPEMTSTSCRCVLKPKERHEYLSADLFDYCADMNVMLMYYKLMDNWQDDRNMAARAEAVMLKDAIARIRSSYPEKIKVFDEAVAELNDLERFESRDVDALSRLSGRMIAEGASWKEDRWNGTLRILGDSLGRFIYLMDAWDDYEEDEKKGRFNPLRDIAHEANFDERCRSILTMLISDATGAFETLPLVSDTEILRNILYSGVWAHFYARLEGRREDRK